MPAVPPPEGKNSVPDSEEEGRLVSLKQQKDDDDDGTSPENELEKGKKDCFSRGKGLVRA